MVDLRSLVISGLFSKPSIYLSHFSYFALKILLVGKKAHQDYMYWNWNWNELMKYIPIQINLRTIYLSSIFSDLPRFSVQLHSKLWIVEFFSVSNFWHFFDGIYYVIWHLELLGGYQWKTSQELRMLSSVTINCQITKIVMNSGSQLSEL